MLTYKIFGTKPLVSIVTPSYNSGRYIEKCIESVLAQDYPDVEHIIQDGASTDNTLSLLKKYSNDKYKKRIRWHSKPDKGPAFASNIAFGKSKGDVILVLNADDALMPYTCSWAVENLTRNPKVAAIYGDVQIIDEKDNEIKTQLSKPYNFTKLICSELVIPAQATFIRRTVFEKIGFYFDQSLENCGDYELWLRVGLKYSIKYVPGIVTKFRWHDKSSTRSVHLIDDFVDQKKKVLNKLFQNPKTPQQIKNLKKRAHTGLYFWAASMAIDSHAKYQALKYLNQSLMINPSEKKLDDYILYWKQAVNKTKNYKTSKGKATNLPLVSIVTPSYNSGNYIEKCIQSILNQDYPYIEHIIQDGSSTDKTKKVLKIYQKSQYQHRIKIFIEPDNGQSDALNRAIQKTKGDIILVLNADDMLLPYAVSWGVKQMKNYPDAGVIYGDTYTINEGGEITDIYKAHDYDFERLLCVELVPPAQAAFIRRSALKKVGFWADANLDTCPDYEMWVRIAQKFPMKHVWGVVTMYRHYRSPQLDSKMPRMTKRFVAAKREVMDRLFNSPRVPKEIKKIRRRAYASLDLWASQVAFEMKDAKGGVYYMLRSFIRRPTVNTFGRIYRTFKMFVYFAFLRIIKIFKS